MSCVRSNLPARVRQKCVCQIVLVLPVQLALSACQHCNDTSYRIKMFNTLCCLQDALQACTTSVNIYICAPHAKDLVARLFQLFPILVEAKGCIK